MSFLTTQKPGIVVDISLTSLNWSTRTSELLRKTSCLGGPNLRFFSFLYLSDQSTFGADDWWKQSCLGWNGGPQARSWHSNEEHQASWGDPCQVYGLNPNAIKSSHILTFVQIGPGNTHRPSCLTLILTVIFVYEHRFCFQGYWTLLCKCSDDTTASTIGMLVGLCTDEHKLNLKVLS